MHQVSYRLGAPPCFTSGSRQQPTQEISAGSSSLFHWRIMARAVGSGKALSIERCSSFAYAFFGGFLKWGTSKSFKICYYQWYPYFRNPSVCGLKHFQDIALSSLNIQHVCVFFPVPSEWYNPRLFSRSDARSILRDSRHGSNM